jgi:hypothetical protein
MKVRLTFKTPDVLTNAFEGLGQDDSGGNHAEILRAHELCKKWVTDGEYLTVEVDTEKETCEVVLA